MEENLAAYEGDDERLIELSSIKAIYPEAVRYPDSPYRLSLEVEVSSLNSQKVIFNGCADTFLSSDVASTDAYNDAKVVDGDGPFQLCHFPALLLDIELPPGYPRNKPPTFSIRTDPEWLPPRHVKELLNDGLEIWNKLSNDAMLFSYIDHLQICAERLFNLCTTPNDTIVLPLNLKTELLEFDKRIKRRKFHEETYACGGCLTAKKGAACHRFSRCGHVFCVECLRDFYKACIFEGSIMNVRCLAPNCAKAYARLGHVEDASGKRRKHDPSISPNELLQIPLDPAVVQRYVYLRRKDRLETDRHIVYCPRMWCQGAARSKRYPKLEDFYKDEVFYAVDEGEIDEDDFLPIFDPFAPPESLPPMGKRVAICEDCGYAFCIVCRRGWHGEAALCPIPVNEPEEVNEEDEASNHYLVLNTTSCPKCGFRCQRSVGCNHMTCFKCQTDFCYLCSIWLPPDDVYSHYRDTKAFCYTRMFYTENDSGEGPV